MPEGTPVRVKKLGHVVFTVSDIERTTRFWARARPPLPGVTYQ